MILRSLTVALLLSILTLTANAQPHYCRDILNTHESTEDLLTQHSIDTREFLKLGELKSYRDGVLQHFINVADPGHAFLQGQFLATIQPQTGDYYDGHQHFKGDTFKSIQWVIFRGEGENENTPLPGMTSINRLVYDYNDEIGEASHMTFTSWALKGLKQSLRRLYSSFESQGPERQALVDLVQEQDRKEIPFVTHFTAMNGINALAHAQILVSDNHNIPLHIETEWPGQAPAIPGKRRGEVGRLFIFGPLDLSEHTPVEWRHWQGMEAESTLVRTELLRRMFSWANHDAALDSLSFQVNSAVLTVLKRMGVRVEHGHQTNVGNNYEGQEITEHIIVFDKEGMKKVEDDLMRKSLRLQLEKFLSLPQQDAEKFILRFSRNEFRSLYESGLFGRDTSALVNSLNQTPPDYMPPHFERILSVDLKNAGQDQRGFLHGYILAPKQEGMFPSLSTLAINEPNFSNGVFKIAALNIAAVPTVTELHFTRAAARAAAAILKR